MNLSRRQFFTALARPQSAPRRGPLPDMPEITPTARFFRQYTHATPRLNAEYWSFSVGGQVRRPLSLSYQDVLSLPSVELPCTLVCVSNRPGGERIGHAVWRGVPMTTLLDQIETPAEAAYARLEAAGGGRTVVPLAALRNGLLATAMNGQPLRPEHGFPARLIIPGLYDHQQPRWIERVELWETPGPGGLWERRGWTANSIATTSGLSVARGLTVESGPVALSGYAFAGPRKITAIEVSVDGGPWVSVDMGESRPNVWTRWKASWPAPGPGDYSLRVRATDESGFVQPETASAPFPNGTSAIHAITVRATGGRFS